MAFPVRKLGKQLEIKIILGDMGESKPELESVPLFVTY